MQRLCHHTCSTSAYSHTYGDHDDPQNLRSSRDCGSRRLWTGSRNSTARRRAAVVLSRSYAALWEATQEREVVVERGGAPGREESSKARGNCVFHLSLGPPLYSGERVHLAPLPKAHLGWCPRERRPRAAVARVGPGRLAPQNLNLAPLASWALRAWPMVPWPLSPIRERPRVNGLLLWKGPN
jgi:hypothetical protein